MPGPAKSDFFAARSKGITKPQIQPRDAYPSTESNMNDLISKIKTYDYKQFALRHGEKIGIGRPGLKTPRRG